MTTKQACIFDLIRLPNDQWSIHHAADATCFHCGYVFPVSLSDVSPMTIGFPALIETMSCPKCKVKSTWEVKNKL